jgi:hypothetical protein
MGFRESRANHEASSARTASGNGTTLAVPVGDVSFALDVTVVSGTTPTLDVKVQWSHDAGTTWFDADTPDTFAQITAAKKTIKLFAAKAPHARIVWTIAGTTPSFTFAAHVIPL